MNLRRESELEVEDEEEEDDVEAFEMVRVLEAEELAVLMSIARLRSIMDDKWRVSDERLGVRGGWNMIMFCSGRPGGGNWDWDWDLCKGKGGQKSFKMYPNTFSNIKLSTPFTNMQRAQYGQSRIPISSIAIP